MWTDRRVICSGTHLQQKLTRLQDLENTIAHLQSQLQETTGEADHLARLYAQRDQEYQQLVIQLESSETEKVALQEKWNHVQSSQVQVSEIMAQKESRIQELQTLYTMEQQKCLQLEEYQKMHHESDDQVLIVNKKLVREQELSKHLEEVCCLFLNG